MKDIALSRRVRSLGEPAASVAVDRVPPRVLEGLRQALLGGETHYTDRPGLRALRERIAARLALPGRDADTVVVTAGEEEARYVARLASSDVAVLSIGKTLFAGYRPEAPGDAVVTGSLDSLAGLSSFRVGFACAPPGLVPSLRSWKQALSICTAAPSQRAALLLLENET
jgi:aspartate/methionine/tyrosine aminotransferase